MNGTTAPQPGWLLPSAAPVARAGLCTLAQPSLLLVQAQTCADLLKTPGGTEQRFRSVLLALAPELLADFHRHHAQDAARRPARRRACAR